MSVPGFANSQLYVGVDVTSELRIVPLLGKAAGRITLTEREFCTTAMISSCRHRGGQILR